MLAQTFTAYDGTSSTSTLVDSFLAANSGIQIVSGSIVLSASDPSALNYYDGSLAPLGIGSGLLLTSGTTPGTQNTVGWFGQDNTQYAADGTPINFYNGDGAIDAVVNAVFQTQSYDATTLSFDFTVSDPAATSISFDIVFGTEEYPEWVDQFVDCAVVIVNGVNYAYFNHDPNAPLSVISPNLAAGYFQDNAGNILPIEYDGVSHVLKIVAPIRPGEINSIKIGIADTGDHIYDSGLFIANMTAGTTPGSGVLITPDVPCTDGNDIVSGTGADDLVNLLGGDDTAYAGGGDDILIGGAGNDHLYGGSGNDVLEGDDGNDYLDGGDGTANEAVYAGYAKDYLLGHDTFGKITLTGADGTDTLVNIQQVRFADGLYDLTADGFVAHSGGSGGAGNSPGVVAVSGIAIVGNTLHATVLDADGLAGTPSFVWQVSTDGGANWTDTAVTSQDYVLTAGDAGEAIRVSVSYEDAKGQLETPVSASATVAKQTSSVTIKLMTLEAPAGASVENPVTTLVLQAIGFGYSPNEAAAAIKAGLGIDPAIAIQHYNPFEALAADATDPVAKAYLKICGELAMAASVSDPSGLNLALAVVEAAANGQVLDLSDAATLQTVLAGVNSASLSLVQGRNADMADASTFDQMKLVWNDFCGEQDHLKPYIGHFETVSIHINQAPVGYAPAAFADHWVSGQDQVIDEATLLAGFSDPEGSALSIDALWTDAGHTCINNNDGTWTVQAIAGYTGPVEVSFIVSDGMGSTNGGTTLAVIDEGADTTAAVATLSGVLVAGEVRYALTFSEAVDGIGVDDFVAVNGSVTSVSGSGSDYTVVVSPDAGFEGTVGLSINAGAASDAAGNLSEAASAAGVAVDTKAPEVSAMAYGANDGTLKAGETVTLAVTFSEAVTVSGTPTIALANGGTATYVGVSGSTVLTFGYTVASGQDTADLATAASGALTGTIRDGAGNAVKAAGFDAVNPAGVLIVDTQAPLAGSFTPADGAIGVAVGSNITIAFSEAIARGAGTIELRAGSATGTLVESFNAATSSRLSISGSTLTIDPTANLANGTHYFVVLAAGTVTDVAGNGFGGTATYDFTTVVAGNVIAGTAGADTLTGTSGIDIISGLAGNDVLTGAGGVDVMDGGEGSDIYMIAAPADHAAAEIADSGIAGVDEVRFSTTTAGATLQLFAADTGIERIVIGTGTSASAVTTGTTALNVNATALGYGVTIIGNAGANALTGGAGNDTLTGGGGTDTFTISAGKDTITDLGLGGADVLNVAAGASAVATLAAAWTASAATVNRGTASLSTNGFAVNLAAVTATTAGNNGYTIVNTGGATSLTGSALADVVTGGTGADIITGGGGTDAMNGSEGSDIYMVGAVTDHAAAEIADTGLSGIDELRYAGTTAATLQLFAGDTGLERVVIGTGTAAAAVTTGTAAINVDASALGYGLTLVGNAGANTLTGGAGDDVLVGGAGNDALNGGLGFDTADYSASTSAITANLLLGSATGAGTDTLTGIEALSGGSGNDILTGNALANLLIGNAGNDTLSGGDGADRLRGGLGNDILTGGAGSDTFVFDTAPNAKSNLDTITDFVSGTDAIAFSKAAFAGLAGLATGTLPSTAFWSGAGVTSAHDADDRLIYNTTTGVLYYDADGSGTASAIVQVAVLGTTSHPSLAFSDVQVVL